MMKLLNQLEQVERATPLALSDDGKISDGIAHGTENVKLAIIFGWQKNLTWAPCRTEAEHIEEKEGHGDPSFNSIVVPSTAKFAHQYRDDEMADEHESGASKE
jgi:hypothetical protein